jgi:hypothetical protein
LVEVSTNRPILIIPDDFYIEDLTKARENSFVYDKIEGPENEGYITGIVLGSKSSQECTKRKQEQFCTTNLIIIGI